MQASLIKEYQGATHNIQVMPVDEDEGLPLSEIYGSVFVEEDLMAVKKTRRPDEPGGSKTLDSVRDMFYVQDKLARRIILQGEAGHGKTVFCLKALDCWSNSKSSCRGAEVGKGVGSVGTKVIGIEQTGVTQGNEFHRGSGNMFGSFHKRRNPAQLTDVKHKDEDNELQNCLSLFDLAFYVPLRYAKHGTSSITDLVCGSVSECDKNTEKQIKLMLRDGKIKCLVILDGLDEWRAPETCRVQGFPDNDGLVYCTLLCTMRPWRMVSLRLGLDSTCDKVVRILGLKSSSIETVISNVLVNFYGLKLSSALYEEKFQLFCGRAQHPELKSLMKIPLMLTASCLVWEEESNVSNENEMDDSDTSDFSDSDQGDTDSDTSDLNESDQSTSYFMTLFYLKLEEITVTRAENKHGMVKSFLIKKRQNPDPTMNVPRILSEFESIIDFIEILKPIGRLALHDLVSEEPHLVFPKNKLEKDIGQSIVELALKAGILSQTKAPGLSYQQRVSVSFYHKSIQEFIAALYMTCGGGEARTTFRTHCNTVDKVMELSNMIMFVFGLDPVVGCQLSEVIKYVYNNDDDIIQYREGDDDHIDRIEKLFKIQCEWFREMKHNLSYTHNTEPPPNIHVTDVQIDNLRNSDVNMSVASELVSMEDNSIVSVYLFGVNQHVQRFIQHLPGCKNLTTLYILIIPDAHHIDMLAKVLPQMVQLQYVEYRTHERNRLGFPQPDSTSIVRAVQDLPALRHVSLCYITLTETVTLPPQLEYFKIRVVDSSDFILQSLCQCSQLKSIELHGITLTDTVKLPPQLEDVYLHSVSNAYFIFTSLPGYTHLNALLISRCSLTMEEGELLVSVLHQLQDLQYITYNGERSRCCHAVVVSALQHLTQLTHIVLGEIDLGDAGTLLVTPQMSQLQEVTLEDVEMAGRRWTEFFTSLLHATQLSHIYLDRIKVSSTDLCDDDDDDDACNPGDVGTLLVTPNMTKLQQVTLREVNMSDWAEFVASLLSVHHTVHVTLTDTNIDDDTVKTIHRSKHFTVTEEDLERNEWGDSLRNIEFHTVR